MEENKSWYQSKGIWGAVVIFISLVAKALGYEFSSSDQSTAIDLITNGATLVGGILALWGRITATKTISKAE